EIRPTDCVLPPFLGAGACALPRGGAASDRGVQLRRRAQRMTCVHPETPPYPRPHLGAVKSTSAERAPHTPSYRVYQLSRRVPAPPARLRCEALCRAFGEVPALGSIGLELELGGLLGLVGLYGCVKPPGPRMLAVLQRRTYGTMPIGVCVVNRIPPKDRSIAL